MLVIKEVHTSYEREEYTKMFNITPKDGCHVMAAHNDGKFVGASYFSYDGEIGTIYLMSLIDGYDDYTDKFLLGKATLNCLDLAGVKNVVYTGDNEVLAKAMGFKKDDEGWKICLTGYFTGHDHGANKGESK